MVGVVVRVRIAAQTILVGLIAGLGGVGSSYVAHFVRCMLSSAG